MKNQIISEQRNPLPGYFSLSRYKSIHVELYTQGRNIQEELYTNRLEMQFSGQNRGFRFDRVTFRTVLTGVS